MCILCRQILTQIDFLTAFYKSVNFPDVLGYIICNSFMIAQLLSAQCVIFYPNRFPAANIF